MTIEKILMDYWPIVSAVAFGMGASIWWASRMTIKMSNVEIGIKEIKQSINDLQGRPVASSQSPVHLNDFGKEISKSSGAEEIAAKCVQHIKIASNMNAYQIQQRCFDYAQNELLPNLTEKERGILETLAYEKGVSLQTILRVIGFDIRDAKLRELKIDDVEIDKHVSDVTPA